MAQDFDSLVARCAGVGEEAPSSHPKQRQPDVSYSLLKIGRCAVTEDIHILEAKTNPAKALSAFCGRSSDILGSGVSVELVSGRIERRVYVVALKYGLALRAI